MPFCCLPNDQLNGLPRGCLSQRQLENCWGNILFYWKWFPSNCLVPYLDSQLSNTQQKGLSLQGRRPSAVRKELAFVWPKWPQGHELVSLWWAVTRGTEFVPSVWRDRLHHPAEAAGCFFPSCLSHKSETWMGRPSPVYPHLPATGTSKPSDSPHVSSTGRWRVGRFSLFTPI